MGLDGMYIYMEDSKVSFVGVMSTHMVFMNENLFQNHVNIIIVAFL